MKKIARFLPVLSLLLLEPPTALGRVRLVTLPPRETVRLDLAHPGESLLEEERTLLLEAGVTQVEFSWQGVSIDPSTILLEPLEHPGEVEILAVRYPPGENTLVWDVKSPRARTERARVSYLLGGIGREASYRAVADTREENLAWREYLLMRNGSGERLENLNVALAAPPAGGEGGFQADLLANESRERLVGRTRVGFRKVLVWDAATRPHDPSRQDRNVGLPIRYLYTNDEAHGLGRSLLSAGKIRLYQEDGRGTTAFLGEDRAEAVAVGAEGEFGVGESRDVVVTRKHLSTNRTREIGGTGNRAVLWDERQVIEMTVENFKNAPVAVRLLDHFAETWRVVDSSHPWTRPDDGTLRWDLSLSAGDSTVVRATIERRNLHNGNPLR